MIIYKNNLSNLLYIKIISNTAVKLICKQRKSMASEYKFGKTVQNIPDIGNKIKLEDMED